VSDRQNTEEDDNAKRSWLGHQWWVTSAPTPTNLRGYIGQGGGSDPSHAVDTSIA